MKFFWTIAYISSLARISNAENAGTGAGEALRFIGGQTPYTQTIRTRVFPGGTFADGIAVSFWFKASDPKTDYPGTAESSGSAGTFFSVWPQVDEIPSGFLPPWYYAADYDVGAFQMGTVYRSGLVEAFASAPGAQEPRWRHFVFSFDNRNGSTLLAIDPGTAEESNLTENDLFRPEELAQLLQEQRQEPSYFLIGSGISADYDLVGELEEFCIMREPISRSTAFEIGKYGCISGALDPSHVLLHYSFDLNDGDDNPLFDTILGRHSGALNSQVQSSDGDLLEYPYMSGKGLGPISVVSSSPLRKNSPTFLRPDLSMKAFSVNVTFSPEGVISWASLRAAPGTGTLCIQTSTLPSGTADTNCTDASTFRAFEVGMNVSVSDAQVWTSDSLSFSFVPWNMSEPQARDSFELVVGFAYGPEAIVKARVVTNAPPRLLNSSIVIKEGESRIVYFPEKQQIVFDEEQSTNELLFEILGFEGAVDGFHIYHCESCGEKFLPDYFSYADDYSERQEVWNNPVLPGDLPYSIYPQERRVILSHIKEAEALGEDIFRIRYRAWDGFAYSNEAILSVNVPILNVPPQAESGSIKIEEDTNAILIDLESLVSDRDGDNYTIEIEAFPTRGTLYQYVSGMWSEGEHEEIAETIESTTISQWVVDDPANSANSCWHSDLCAGALVGEPTTYPRTGDGTGTWQPVTTLTDLWLIVTFETPVFAKELSLFEVWSPGGTFKIEVENVDMPGEWTVAWEGPTRQKTFCPELAESAQCAGIARYTLCPQPFRTKRVKIHLRMESASRWPAVDAVLLDGSVTPRGNLLLDAKDLRGRNKLWYKPFANEFGTDSFQFAVSDCPYFDVNRRLKGPDTRRASFQIDITPLQDAPQFEAWSVPAVVVPQQIGGPTTTAVRMTDVDGIDKNVHRLRVFAAASGDRVAINVFGSRVSEELEVGHENWSYESNTTILIPLQLTLLSCDFAEEQIVSFDVEASDGNKTTRGQFDIKLQCNLLPTMLRRNTPQQDEITALSSTLFAMGLILVILSTVWLISRRKTKAVKLMSGLANLSTILGSGLVYGYVWILAWDGSRFTSCQDLESNRLLQNMTTTHTEFEHCPDLGILLCMPRLWMLVLGMTMAISTLFVKAERVNKIFNNKNLRKVKFPSSKLAKMVAAYLSVACITLLVFQLLSPQQYVATLSDPTFDADLQVKVRLVTEYCTSSQQSLLQLALVLGFGFMIIRGAYLAYVTRNVSVPEMNDSKEIGLSIYNILVVGGISFGISFAISDPSAKYFATAIPVWLCTSIMLGVLFLPKIIQTELRGFLSSGSGESRRSTVRPTTTQAFQSGQTVAEK